MVTGWSPRRKSNSSPNRSVKCLAVVSRTQQCICCVRRGLYQCDEIAFKDVQQRSRQADIDALKAAFDFDLRKVEWDDLNLSSLLATVLARLHYKLKSEAIPLTLLGRAGYWKKFYNTSSGKGSAEEYIARAKPFQVYF